MRPCPPPARRERFERPSGARNAARRTRRRIPPDHAPAHRPAKAPPHAPSPPRQARPRAHRSRHGCGPAPPPARVSVSSALPAQETRLAAPTPARRRATRPHQPSGGSEGPRGPGRSIVAVGAGRALRSFRSPPSGRFATFGGKCPQGTRFPPVPSECIRIARLRRAGGEFAPGAQTFLRRFPPGSPPKEGEREAAQPRRKRSPTASFSDAALCAELRLIDLPVEPALLHQRLVRACSTMSPSRMTRIRSALRMVESRCAMMKLVRPFMLSSMPSGCAPRCGYRPSWSPRPES